MYEFQGAARRVCVIGAGIAGLVTARVLSEDGFDVLVFERLPTIGGVWAASRTYPGLRANNPRETYAFSDFPYPVTADEYPTAEQVRAYLNDYVDHFELRPLLRLGTEVCNVSRASQNAGDGSAFEVQLRTTEGSRREARLHCDFVVVCNGVFSQPHVPAIDGRTRFVGEVLHSSEISDPQALEDKRVVVVGAGKSALDCACWAAEQSASCTLICRAPHWMVPRYFWGRIRADKLILTRFSELFIRYHSPSRVESFLHGPARPLVKLWWCAQTQLLRGLLRLPNNMIPEHPLPVGFENIGIGGEFYDRLRRGNLQVRRARLREFSGPTTLALDTDETVEADVVIFGTGWRQDVAFLDADLRAAVWKNGKFNLYRHVLPPREPRLGFVGYASSIACQLSSEIAAHWLSQCFRGELNLPPVWQLEREIARVQAWAEDVFPARPEGYFIGPFIAHYLDELMRDMGLETFRTSQLLTEYFAPFWPVRYRDVGHERRQVRASLAFSDIERNALSNAEVL